MRVAIQAALCYSLSMKRFYCLLLLLCLLPGLCACGRDKNAPIDPGLRTDNDIPIQVTPTPLLTRSVSIPITLDNWDAYFEIREIPLYLFNPNGGVLELKQNYCVVLREEFAHRMLTYGDYRVNFTVSFDVYVNQLDYDKENNLFLHTDDLFYAMRAEHTCAFTAMALPTGASGSSYGAYLQSLKPDYENAFFTGTANYTDGVWAGFYVDLGSVEVLSAEGTLDLG